MSWINRKRSVLEKINNDRIKVIVGLKGLNETELSLREPFMTEVTRFIEDAISECTETYLNNVGDLEKIAAKGTIDIQDMRLLSPMMKPIMGLIAIMGDREDLKDTLHEIVTVSQFAECFNAALHLIDVEKLIPNFTMALGKIQTVVEKMKKS